MAEYIEYHPLKFWLDPASIAEIVAHIQTYLVNNPINSTTEIETIIHDYLIAHPEIIGGVRSINGETGEVVLTADNISAGENVTIKDVLDSLQDQIDDIVASIPSDYQQLINDVSDLKSALNFSVDTGYIDPIANELEIGRIRTGEDVNSKYYLRTKGFFESNDIIYLASTGNDVLSTFYIYEYDSNGTYLSGQPVNGSILINNTTGKKYRISFTYSEQHIITDPSEGYDDYVIYGKISDVITEIESNIEALKPVNGLSWVTLGDSLTDPVTLSVFTGEETKNYTNIVAEKLGLTLTNLGKSGSGYWRKSTVANPYSFYHKALEIPTDTKIVTIFGSFNDMGRDGDIRGSDILGTIYDETTDTVGGCINQTLKNIFATAPNAVVGVILPTPWDDMTMTQAQMTVYEPYVNLVKGVAERYSLPVLDLFHHSNLRPWVQSFRAAYFINENDGDHPNHYGHQRISGMIEDFVASLAKGIK